MKIVDWVSGDEISNDMINANDFKPDKIKPYYDCIIDTIKVNGYAFTGEDHQAKYMPLFEDGTYWKDTFRGWGWIMAEAYNIDVNDNYLWFAYNGWYKFERKYPKKSVKQ